MKEIKMNIEKRKLQLDAYYEIYIKIDCEHKFLYNPIIDKQHSFGLWQISDNEKRLLIDNINNSDSNTNEISIGFKEEDAELICDYEHFIRETIINENDYIKRINKYLNEYK